MKKLKKRKLRLIFIIGLLLMLITIYKKSYIHEYEIIQLIDGLSLKLKKNNIYDYNNFKYNFIKKICNKPWVALYTSNIYFVNISLGGLLFLIIQYISKSKWSLGLIKIMESIISFFPFGGMNIFILIILNYLGINNIFYNKKNIISFMKKLIISFIYIYGINFFIKRICEKEKDLKKKRKYSVLFVIFFSLIFPFIGWNWIMFFHLDWISTIFNWYLIGTNLVLGISLISLLSICLNKKKVFLNFKKKHLQNLSNYLFSASFLWCYFLFAQFLLIWYSNIPEETLFYSNKILNLKNLDILLIIINFIIPFLFLIKKKLKKNKKIIIFLCLNILIGNYLNIYNLITSDNVGIMSGLGIEEISSLILIGSLFFLKIKNFLIKK
ncbi:hypothetical protein [Candidatus Karelsulcia muelleri]|uniref:hypothetical protein n=1 Tax=Candidatus Karelsulcia muelleri TaxID=336810 RepID=UPI000D7CCB27|nr:hypothetical protein [Candidatus Karelsulcia muelleri]